MSMLAIGTLSPRVVTTVESRLRFHDDPVIPGIRVLKTEDLSCLERLKLACGGLLPATLPSETGMQNYCISLKSFSKHTGLTYAQAPPTLTCERALRNISRLACVILANVSPKETCKVYKSALQSYSLELLEREFPDLSEEIYIAHSSQKTHLLVMERQLGSGLDSEVWQVKDAVTPEAAPLALKKSTRLRPIEELEAMLHLMQKLNPKGETVGIQRPHHKVVVLSRKDQGPCQGFLTEKYEGSLKDFHFPDASHLLKAVQQLTQGLSTLQAKQYCHRDIKPSNMLFNSERFDLSDLDDCQDLGQIQEILRHHQKQRFPSCLDTTLRLWAVSTDFYCCSKDEDALAEKVAQFDQGILCFDQASRSIFRLLQGRDLFAFGLSLLELIHEKSARPSELLEGVQGRLISLGLTKDTAHQIKISLEAMLKQDIEMRFRGFETLKTLLV